MKFHEQFFARTSANSLLVSSIAILVLTLILPEFYHQCKWSCLYATSIDFCLYSFVLTIYSTFLLVQTVRHRNYFLPKNKEEKVSVPTFKESILSFITLLVCLGIVSINLGKRTLYANRNDH